MGSTVETAGVSAPVSASRVAPQGRTDPVWARAYAHRLGDVVLVLTVALGAVLRLRQYLFARSFWNDELFLAVNVRDRSMIGLTKPLSLTQAAPLGFLWSAKLSIVAFGQHELAYRLVPVVSGIVTVACVALFSRRLFSPPAAIAATGMIAIANESIRYSSEFKQYTMEAAMAALLLLVATYCLGPTLSDELRYPAVLAATGALALVCSVSAALVLTGIGLVLLVQTVRSRRYERYVALAVIGLTWVAAATVMYVVSWSNDAKNPKLHSYWKADFGPTPWSHPGWYVSAWTAMIKDQVAISWSAAALGLTVVGALWLGRRAPTLAVIAVMTVLAAMVGSWTTIYPFNGRLLLFLVPTVCLLFGSAVDAVATLLPGRAPAVGSLVALACAAGLVSVSVETASTKFHHPYQYEETRQLLEALRPRFRPGERLFVANRAILAFNFYRDRTGFADVPIVIQQDDPDRIPSFQRQLRHLGPGRIWILFNGLHPGPDVANPDTVRNREAVYFSEHLNGPITGSIHTPGAWALEFDQTR